MYTDDDMYDVYYPEPQPGDQGTCANCSHLITLIVVNEPQPNTLVWAHTTTEHCDKPELGGPA